MSGEGIARTAVIVSVRRIGEIIDPDRPEETRRWRRVWEWKYSSPEHTFSGLPGFLLGKGRLKSA